MGKEKGAEEGAKRATDWVEDLIEEHGEGTPEFYNAVEDLLKGGLKKGADYILPTKKEKPSPKEEEQKPEEEKSRWDKIKDWYKKQDIDVDFDINPPTKWGDEGLDIGVDLELKFDWPHKKKKEKSEKTKFPGQKPLTLPFPDPYK